MSVAKIAFSAIILLSVSCAQKGGGIQQEAVSKGPQWRVDEKIWQNMEKGQGRLEVSLDRQKLVLRDRAGRVALETDCSTGIPGRETPTGTFRIKEMIVDKRSNKYGKYVSEETGEVVVEKSWEVRRKPPGTRYLGIAMPYWMRLTWQGVGIHVGEFHPGQRSSFGCIRMPEGIQPLVYEKSAVGMPVTIRRD